MIVLKSVHEALLKAKDEQIAHLQDEVRFLRHLLQPIERKEAFAVSAEANAVLDGAQDQIDLSDNDVPDEVLAERDRLLSGTY